MRSMLCKKCNKEIPTMLIINTNVYTLAEYLRYKENGNELCMKCFINKKYINNKGEN